MNLETLLRDLPRVGTLVKDRGHRQVWRFTWSDRAYYLKFYPRGGFRDRWRRRFRGSPARREFERLQWLQKAKVAAPRAAAYLVRLTLEGRKGDAVILEAIEPAFGERVVAALQASARPALQSAAGNSPTDLPGSRTTPSFHSYRFHKLDYVVRRR